MDADRIALYGSLQCGLRHVDNSISDIDVLVLGTDAVPAIVKASHGNVAYWTNSACMGEPVDGLVGVRTGKAAFMRQR